MNYSFIPQKVTKTINIYDGTCTYCLSERTFPVINMLDCKLFSCMNCHKQFTSTKIKETKTYTTEKPGFRSITNTY